MSRIANSLNALVKWEDFTDASGAATHVGSALTELLGSKTVSEVKSAYWQLENRIVVQGTVYNSCIPASRVLIAALLEECSMPVKISILELLYQILKGVPASREGNCDIVEQCKAAVNEGLWLVVREFIYGPRDAARDVLDQLHTDLDFEALVQ